MKKAFSNLEESFAFKALRLILVACLFAPLIASDGFVFPYTAPKGFFFRILAEAGFLFYLFICLKYPSFRPKWNLAFKSVLAFFAVNLISGILGADWNSSFWGSQERMTGIWGLAHFLAFFMMLSSVFRLGESKKTDMMRLAAWFSTAVAVLGLLQKAGGLGNLLPPSQRVFGTAGNAAFLGSYLIFGIFFSFYLILKNIESGRSSWLFGFFAIIQISALLATGTRGAFLGLFFGIICAGALFVFYSGSKKIKNLSIAFLAAIIALGVLLMVFKDSSLVKSSAALNRLSRISLSENTAQSRLVLWRQSWSAWKQEPVFGWGPENFEIALNANFSSDLNQYEAWHDRAHNFIFDYGTTLGWAGLASFAGIFAASFISLKKKKEKDFYLFAAFCPMFAAYLVQAFFVFDSFICLISLFFALAVAGSEAAPAFEKEKTQKVGFGGKIFLFACACAVFIAIAGVNIPSAKANREASDILGRSSLEYAKNLSGGEKNGFSPAEFYPEEISYQIVMDYLARINTDAELTKNENFYKLFSAQLEKKVVSSPLNLKYRIALAWLNLYFSGPDRSRLSRGIELGERAKEISPQKRDPYILLIAAYSISGQSEKAEQTMEEAQNLDRGTALQAKEYWQKFQ